MMEDIALQKSNVTQTIETVMNSSFVLPTNGNTPVFSFSALISLILIVLVVSLPLNIYVLWLLVTAGGNGAGSELFSLNLCVCEIIICSSAVFSLLNIILYKNDPNSPLCYFLAFLSIMHNTSRPFFQCCVCVERYVAVIHPLIFLKYKPLRYHTALAVITWIIVLGFSVFCPFLLLRNILYYILLPVYLLVFSIEILCSIAVLKALRKPRPGEKLSIKDAESNSMKKKSFRVIVIILVFMFITYCPMMMALFMYDSLSETQKLECLTAFSYFVILGGFGHPFVYLHRVGKLPFIPGF